MTKTFNNLDENKQQRILNAALKEFAENGYEQASTNRIVKNAGIGKGMLFYYFNNKKELYHYLIDYAINVMIDEYFSLIDTKESDFVERLKQIAQVKSNYYYNHPDVSNFIGNIYLDDQAQLPEGLEKRLHDLQIKGYSLLYDNVDTSLFRGDVNVEKVYKLIRWSIEGYQSELMDFFKGQNISFIDLEPYWEEFDEYLEILKTSFYKQEGEFK
ncbi:TetR family transcriptional regulator [Virgibacillus sp. NKC19-16]|nr:TetR/AcrR family transcriptional regulator [Virgibacillus sp. NKC19-16]UJL48139.1 TetR family transcriptional regulator [Virgibacillus sp. NKC19-16]